MAKFSCRLAVNPGGYEAGVTVPSSDIGIVINANSGDAVSLRGLTIDGGGNGTTGIRFITGTSLTLENCIVRHVTQDGIDFLSSSATSALTVSYSLVADNGNNSIQFEPTGRHRLVQPSRGK